LFCFFFFFLCGWSQVGTLNKNKREGTGKEGKERGERMAHGGMTTD
jgi:hypothetical protein